MPSASRRRFMSRSKASVLAVLTTLLATAAMFGLPYNPAAVVKTTVAARGEWTRTVLVSGTVGYRRQPCAALQTGILAEVLVSPEQAVQKGDLLFQMDTSAQERALAAVKSARYQQQTLLDTEAMAAVIAVQKDLEWQETERQLLDFIETAQVRAHTDGVVENVYAQPGEYVSAGALLGMVREGEKCVMAFGRADTLAGLQPGADAILRRNGEVLGKATVESISAPDTTGRQQMILQPANALNLAQCESGEKITAEIAKATFSDCTLIPISAMDENGKVWFVNGGRACSEQVEVRLFDDAAAVVSDHWEGRRVVLNPKDLTEGCRVKEANVE